MKDRIKGWLYRKFGVMPCPCYVGDIVRDDLTRREAMVKGVAFRNGQCDKPNSDMSTWGIWLDAAPAYPQDDGGRHPWEISGGNWM